MWLYILSFFFKDLKKIWAKEEEMDQVFKDTPTAMLFVYMIKLISFELTCYGFLTVLLLSKEMLLLERPKIVVLPIILIAGVIQLVTLLIVLRKKKSKENDN